MPAHNRQDKKNEIVSSLWSACHTMENTKNLISKELLAKNIAWFAVCP